VFYVEMNFVSIAISLHQEQIFLFKKNDPFKFLPPKNPGIKRGEGDIKPSDCCGVPMLMPIGWNGVSRDGLE
jgi:hypothetical protein